MTTSKFIGNIKSKEFHKPDCFTLKNCYNINQRPFYSKKQAITEGYDACGHCLKPINKKRNTTNLKEHYFGHFYGIFHGISTEDKFDPIMDIGENFQIFAILQKAVFEEHSWKMKPVANHKIAISCDFINFPAKNTDSNGLVRWDYTIPPNFEPGTTSIRVRPHISEPLIWHNNTSVLFFEVPQQIEILKNIPTYFEQKTKILFKLKISKRIQADIYRGLSESEFSHIKNLRNFKDGVMEATDEAVLEWNGTVGQGFREGKPAMKGRYKIVIRGENGASDRDELVLHKKGGMAAEPETDAAEEYVSNINFLQNPFSEKTKTPLNFVLKKDAKVSIHIQHANWKFQGKCVKEFINNEDLKKGVHSYTWNGRNNLGLPATLGAYKVRIMANGKTYIKTGLWKKADWNL
jgi:hypothetical protein